MKIILTPIIFLFSLNLVAQNSFTENLYSKIVFEEIEIRNSDNLIINEKELFNLLFKIDTSNIYYSSNSHFYNLISYLYINNISEYLEIEYVKNESKCRIIKPIYSGETVELIEEQLLFSIDTNLIANLESNKIKPTGNPQDEQLKQNWCISRIIVNSKLIELDTCLKSYRIQFDLDHKFSQGYSSADKCGKEFDDLDFYQHYLDYIEGYWQINSDRLILVDNTFKRPIIWDYEIKQNKLILKKGDNYTVEFTSINK